jgi:hypothetical protein
MDVIEFFEFAWALNADPVALLGEISPQWERTMRRRTTGRPPRGARLEGKS